MTDVAGLIERIDQELSVEVKREKTIRAEILQTNRDREQRMQCYEPTAKHLIDLLKPRFSAFIERFKAVAKAEPHVHGHTRALKMTFAATVAKVTLTFEVYPDQDASHLLLECTQEIVPVLVRYDRQSILELPLDGVKDDAAIQWFDERILAFVKAYLAIIRQDDALKEKIKDQLVEDPVTKIRFPSYLASSTLKRDGLTYYFVDEDTRREFEKDGVAKK
jgi:YHS domain-containing protein